MAVYLSEEWQGLKVDISYPETFISRPICNLLSGWMNEKNWGNTPSSVLGKEEDYGPIIFPLGVRYDVGVCCEGACVLWGVQKWSWKIRSPVLWNPSWTPARCFQGRQHNYKSQFPQRHHPLPLRRRYSRARISFQVNTTLGPKAKTQSREVKG